MLKTDLYSAIKSEDSEARASVTFNPKVLVIPGWVSTVKIMLV